MAYNIIYIIYNHIYIDIICIYIDINYKHITIKIGGVKPTNRDGLIFPIKKMCVFSGRFGLASCSQRRPGISSSCEVQNSHGVFCWFNGHFRNLNWRYLPYIRPI
jgi:hypothetical protein